MRSHSHINIAAVALLLAVAAVVSACAESFEDRCRREAREYTEKQCPRRLDDFVTVDSMAYIEQPQGFAYYYSVNDDAGDADLLTDDIKEEFLNHLRQNVRKDITMKTYKEKGFYFTYKYYSKATGDVFIEATFGPEDYR